MNMTFVKVGEEEHYKFLFWYDKSFGGFHFEKLSSDKINVYDTQYAGRTLIAFRQLMFNNNGILEEVYYLNISTCKYYEKDTGVNLYLQQREMISIL